MKRPSTIQLQKDESSKKIKIDFSDTKSSEVLNWMNDLENLLNKSKEYELRANIMKNIHIKLEYHVEEMTKERNVMNQHSKEFKESREKFIKLKNEIKENEIKENEIKKNETKENEKELNDLYILESASINSILIKQEESELRANTIKTIAIDMKYHKEKYTNAKNNCQYHLNEFNKLTPEFDRLTDEVKKDFYENVKKQKDFYENAK